MYRLFLDAFGNSRWVKNDYELVRWPPDAEKDKAAGIKVAGEADEDDTPNAAEVSRGTIPHLSHDQRAP